MSKSRAEIDEWARALAPSTALRRWCALAQGRTVTPLTASRDRTISEAVVLAELLEDQPEALPWIALIDNDLVGAVSPRRTPPGWKIAAGQRRAKTPTI